MEKRRSDNRKRFRLSLLLTILLLGILAGCEKGVGDCFTSTGKIVTEERQVADFDSIEVDDYLNVILTQDTVNRVIVEAGKNIIHDLTTDVVDRQLILKNKTSCNWVRSYSKSINIHVHAKNLLKIYYNSSGNVTSANRLVSDSLKVDIWGGCGTIDLDVDISNGYFLLHLGTANMILRGTCDICAISMYDYGKVDAGGMRSGYGFVNNRSSNDCYVQAWQALEATIGNIGNIYYTGNPGQVVTHINGPGKVIPY